MRRGEVRLVDFEPVIGSEADKRRPAVVVSNNRANAASARTGKGVITVVPITSNVARIYPFQVLLPTDASGLALDSKAQAEQVRSVAVQRVGPVLGVLPPSAVAQVDSALRLHLNL